MTKTEYLFEYDRIVKTMQMYVDGSKQGKSELMRPAFHSEASFFGYAGEQLAVGTEFLFQWIDKNGPAPHIEPRVVSVDILDSIAVVRLEVAGWSGNLAGGGVHVRPIHAPEDAQRMEDYPESVSLARCGTQCSSLISVIYFGAGVQGMPERNTPQKTLESWKQIAAYLDRSERTVRRWEASEGLPVHRRKHEKQDTVFAFRHELEAWSRSRTKCPGPNSTDQSEALSALKPVANTYLTEHDAITRTMHLYIAAARAGDGDLMRAAFHPSATISGYCQGVEYSGSVEHVFEWITANGPAPNINPRFARIEIIESIAVVHLEVQRWSGKLAGANARASDVFTLLKWNGEWKITHKLFHWHDHWFVNRILPASKGAALDGDSVVAASSSKGKNGHAASS